MQSTFAASIAVLALIIGAIIVYYRWLGPLRAIPGPYTAKITPLALWFHSFRGYESDFLEDLHKEYGPIIRIAPKEVSFNDGAVQRAIYFDNRGLSKSSYYSNFDYGDQSVIVSILDNAQSITRTRIVAKLFSLKSVGEATGQITNSVNRMIELLGQSIAQSQGPSIDILALSWDMAIDCSSAYLFGHAFGAMDGRGSMIRAWWYLPLSISRFWYLPKPLCKFAVSWYDRLSFGEYEYVESPCKPPAGMRSAENYLGSLLDQDVLGTIFGGPDTFQSRMVGAGIEKTEILAQMEDALFAASYLVGINFARMLVFLAGNPVIIGRLEDELREGQIHGTRTKPYHQAVVEETLRLADTAPVRMQRLVGKQGLHISGYPSISAGTNVSVSIRSLHLNEKVFPNAELFSSERWLESEPAPDMKRDLITFGAGRRQCIGQNLATAILSRGLEAIVRADILRGVEVVEDVSIVQWAIPKVKGGKVLLRWPRAAKRS